MRALDHALVVLAAYLAGLCTAALVRRLRYRASGARHTAPEWWCRRFHGRHHVAYSVCSPGARWCMRCGCSHDYLEDAEALRLDAEVAEALRHRWGVDR